MKKRVKAVLTDSGPNILSTAVISEIYRLTLEREGKVVAEMRCASLAKDFKLVDVDKDIAIQAAIIKHKHGLPFADSLVASTAKVLGVPCYTDDPHFHGVDGVTVRWFL